MKVGNILESISSFFILGRILLFGQEEEKRKKALTCERIVINLGFAMKYKLESDN